MIVDINGIEVKFPFEPYELQRNYMSKVIEALQKEQNAVLESPTGTGKTLCLLCSSLAWLADFKLKNAHKDQAESLADRFYTPPHGMDERKWHSPKIIYTSRTHSQLTQAMREMKNSAYSNISAVSLGSRDHLCINDEVLTKGKTAAERNNLCQVKVNKRLCSFRERSEKVMHRAEVVNMPIKDIEDLVTIGKKCKACPYYLSRDLATNADIVFMPYNYLFDAKILQCFKINLKGAVIIIDEGHNIEKVCEELASIVFASSDITNCINDITHVMKTLEKDDVANTFKIEDLVMIKEMMFAFENEVNSIECREKGKTFPGGTLFDLLEAVKINIGTYPMIRELLEHLILFLTESSSGSGRKGGGLMKMLEVVDTAFSGGDSFKQSMERGFRVHVEIEKSTNVWVNQPKIINYWCFDPSFGMANVVAKKLRSIILTSGTLAPLNPLISELAITVTQRLENPHIIKESQVIVKVVSAGPDKESLDGSYANRENPKYIKSLGLTIQGISRVTPNGVLVFFSSYTLMNKYHQTWVQCGMWNAMQEIKPIFTEPRNKDEFQKSIKVYYETAKSNTGAIYMAVVRGKVSEGLDFNDHNARAVIICGIPFPPFMDPRVVLKKSYLDTNRNHENQLQSGREWYTLEAVRAVNQAIGRVIRHKDDFGAILLCDRRFHSYKSQLSRWIQPHLNNDVNFGRIVGEVAKFFRNPQISCPVSRFIDKTTDVLNMEVLRFKQPRPIDFTQDESPTKKPRFPGEAEEELTEENILKVRVKVKRDIWNKTTPTVKGEFINALKHEVDHTAYKMFLQAFYLYHTDTWDLNESMNEYVKVFKVYKRAVNFLRVTRDFIRDQDKHTFDVTINKHFIIID